MNINTIISSFKIVNTNVCNHNCHIVILKNLYKNTEVFDRTTKTVFC